MEIFPKSATPPLLHLKTPCSWKYFMVFFPFRILGTFWSSNECPPLHPPVWQKFPHFPVFMESVPKDSLRLSLPTMFCQSQTGTEQSWEGSRTNTPCLPTSLAGPMLSSSCSQLVPNIQGAVGAWTGMRWHQVRVECIHVYMYTFSDQIWTKYRIEHCHWNYNSKFVRLFF